MSDDKRPEDATGTDSAKELEHGPLDAGTGPDESDPTPVLGEDDDERFDAG